MPCPPSPLPHTLPVLMTRCVWGRNRPQLSTEALWAPSPCSKAGASLGPTSWACGRGKAMHGGL